MMMKGIVSLFRNAAIALLSFAVVAPLLGAPSDPAIVHPEVNANPGENIHYLDSKNGNFLFRGANPDFGCPFQFDYSDTVGGMRNAAKGHGTLPQTFYLVDISLVQFDTDCSSSTACDNSQRGMVRSEFDYFNQNPTKGEFHYWEGDYPQIDPTSDTLSPEFRDYLVKTLDWWMPGNLPARVEQLHTWLLHGVQGVNLPVVIYFHCQGGKDRTGEMAGAYSLRYLNLSWREMNVRNLNAGNGPDPSSPSCDKNATFGCGNYYATHWYCFYLNSKYGMKLDCTTPWNSSTPWANCPLCAGPPSCQSTSCRNPSCWPPCTHP